jgi:hypothetical protein
MSIERAPSTVSLVLAQVQRVEPKPPIFLLSRFTEIFWQVRHCRNRIHRRHMFGIGLDIRLRTEAQRLVLSYPMFGIGLLVRGYATQSSLSFKSKVGVCCQAPLRSRMASYEFVLVHNGTGRRAGVQVKRVQRGAAMPRGRAWHTTREKPLYCPFAPMGAFRRGRANRSMRMRPI